MRVAIGLLSAGRRELMRVAIGLCPQPQRGGKELMDNSQNMLLAPCV